MQVGFVDEIVGEGGKLHSEFAPTRYEIEVLVRHWAWFLIENDFFYWKHRSTGSTDYRMAAFADRRLNRIGQLLGEEFVETIWRETESSLEQSVGKKEWKRFCKWRSGSGDESEE